MEENWHVAGRQTLDGIYTLVWELLDHDNCFSFIWKCHPYIKRLKRFSNFISIITADIHSYWKIRHKVRNAMRIRSNWK